VSFFENEIAWLGSFIIIGWSFGLFLMCPYADRHGRKTPFIMSLLIEAIVWPFLLTVTDLKMAYFLCFVFGCCIGGRYTIGFVMLCE